MVGDIWGMDGFNPIVGRCAKAARSSTGTTDSDSTIHNRGGARDDISASDSGRYREAHRYDRQAHSYCRSAQSTTRGARSTHKAEWKLLVPKPADL
jgi:hypothetical protein